MVRHWFQNLKRADRSKRLFHFRGSVNYGKRLERCLFKYEVASGRAIRFRYTHGEACDDGASSQISLGLFFFTLYLTFYLPKRFYFQRKCIATWDNDREFWLIQGREYGFYVYDWAIVWHFHAKVHESSSRAPWWMHQYIHLDKLVFGKTLIVKDELISEEKVAFKMGEKEFVMDSIKWSRWHRFRSRIPFALYHKTNVYVEMKIDKPPMYQGKGENSWDCGDDGTYGTHQLWPHEAPTWQNRKESTKLAVDLYVDGVMRDVGRRGGSSSESGIDRDSVYQFIGPRPIANGVAETST